MTHFSVFDTVVNNAFLFFIYYLKHSNSQRVLHTRLLLYLNILLIIYSFNLKVFVKYKWVFSSKNFQIHCPWCSGKVHLRNLSCCLRWFRMYKYNEFWKKFNCSCDILLWWWISLVTCNLHTQNRSHVRFTAHVLFCSRKGLNDVIRNVQ